MNDIILSKLKLKNVFCYDDLEIDFHNGSNLILGQNYKEGFVSNASGKTSIVNAASHILKGQVPNGLLQDEIIKSDKDYMYEEIELLIEKRIVNISRERKRGHTTKISMSQEEIDSLLGISDYIDFLNLIYITDAGTENLFSSKYMKNADKLGIISRISDLSPIDRILEFVLKETSSTQKSLSNISSEKVGIESMVTGIEHILTLEKNLIDINYNIKEKENRLKKVNKEISLLEKSDTVDLSLFAAIEILKDKIEEKTDDLKTVLIEFVLKDSEIDYSIPPDILDIGIKRKSDIIEKRNKEKTVLENSISVFNRNLNKEEIDTCFNCASPLMLDESGYIVKYNKNEIENNIKLLRDRISVIEENNVADTEEIEEFKEKKENIKRYLFVEENKINLETTIKSLNEELLNKQEQVEGKNRDIAQLLSDLKLEKEELEKELFRLSGEKGSNDNDLKTWKSYEEKIKDKDKQYNKEKQYVDSLLFWKIGYKEIKRRMIENLLPEFEEYCNIFLDKFGTDFLLRLSTLSEKASKKGEFKDKFSLNLFDILLGEERSIRTASFGEEKRILLSIFFALNIISNRRNINNCNFILVDEILNNLDQEGILKFFDIIGADSKQKIIVSNDSSLSEFFDNTIVCINEGNRCFVER